jgi:hypothetical protein
LIDRSLGLDPVKLEFQKVIVPAKQIAVPGGRL